MIDTAGIAHAPPVVTVRYSYCITRSFSRIHVSQNFVVLLSTQIAIDETLGLIRSPLYTHQSLGILPVLNIGTRALVIGYPRWYEHLSKSESAHLSLLQDVLMNYTEKKVLTTMFCMSRCSNLARHDADRYGNFENLYSSAAISVILSMMVLSMTRSFVTIHSVLYVLYISYH